MKIFNFILMFIVSVVSTISGIMVATYLFSYSITDSSVSAVSIITGSLSKWGDFVTLYREKDTGQCMTYDPKTGNNVGPWPVNADGKCHIGDYIRLQVIETLKKN
jgi:hypothetical protein